MPLQDQITRLRELLAKATERPWAIGRTGKEVEIPYRGTGHVASAFCGSEANAHLVVESANTLPSLLDRIEQLEEALKTMRNYGCPVCSGDCGSANPPVGFCPMTMIDRALRATITQEKDRDNG